MTPTENVMDRYRNHTGESAVHNGRVSYRAFKFLCEQLRDAEMKIVKKETRPLEDFVESSTKEDD